MFVLFLCTGPLGITVRGNLLVQVYVDIGKWLSVCVIVTKDCVLVI